VREFIQAIIENEFKARYPTRATPAAPRRIPRMPMARMLFPATGTATRPRSLIGTLGRVEIAVPHARLDTAEGKTTEWKSKMLRA